MEERHEVACLFSMVSKKGERNHAHGTPLPFLQMQADALGIPLIMIDSAGDYEQSLINGLKKIKEQFKVSAVAFGTLYVEEDRKWNEDVTVKAGLEPLFPTWISKNEVNSLLDEWLSKRYEAVICRAKEKYFDAQFIGTTLNNEIKELLIDKKICALGEGGEYHTFVIDGPLFKKKLNIADSEVILIHGLWSLNIKDMVSIDKN